MGETFRVLLPNSFTVSQGIAAMLETDTTKYWESTKGEQVATKAAALGEITASDIVRQAMEKLSTLNIDGPEAVAAAAQALNDMHKAGALRVRPPVSHTVTVSTPIKGWNFKPSEGANIDGTGYLVRAKDGVLIRASGDRRVWERQIVDFEFLDGIEWTPQQIAAITDPGLTHDIAVVQHESVSISPTSDMPTYYDVNFDERRPITQEIVDNMERGIQKLIAERDEIRSGKAPDALLVADRNARVRERDDARKEVTHWQKECTRAVGLFEERGRALLRILGDMPSPDENAFERCRAMAAEALGYQRPDPMVFPEYHPMAAPAELISDGERIWHTRALIAEGRVAELEGKDERAEAHESLAYWKAEAKRLADGPPTQHPPEFVAQVLMEREGRSDPMALARLTEVIRCARLDGRKQARDEVCERQARVLGDADNEIARLFEVAKERNALIASLGRSGAAQADEIATLRTELMAARDTMARATSERDGLRKENLRLVLAQDELPKPVPNPFREFPRDMRRMGP